MKYTFNRVRTFKPSETDPNLTHSDVKTSKITFTYNSNTKAVYKAATCIGQKCSEW